MLQHTSSVVTVISLFFSFSPVPLCIFVSFKMFVTVITVTYEDVDLLNLKYIYKRILYTIKIRILFR